MSFVVLNKVIVLLIGPLASVFISCDCTSAVYHKAIGIVKGWNEHAFRTGKLCAPCGRFIVTLLLHEFSGGGPGLAGGGGSNNSSSGRAAP